VSEVQEPVLHSPDPPSLQSWLSFFSRRHAAAQNDATGLHEAPIPSMPTPQQRSPPVHVDFASQAIDRAALPPLLPPPSPGSWHAPNVAHA
jgi:hypothetical protein